MQSYQHSGIVPVAGAAFAVVGGAIAALLGGFLYAYLIVKCPIIYLCVLGTLAFGALIGFAIGFASQAGKIRNNTVRIGLTFVFATIGIYTEWAISLCALGAELTYVECFHPAHILALIETLYENGTWGFGGGAPVKGVILVLFWIAEIIIIYGAAFFVANSVADDLPFCESCNCWTEWTRGIHSVKADGSEAEWEQAKLGNLGPASLLPPVDETTDTIVRFDTATCAKCGQSAYLTMNRIKFTVTNDGDVKEDVQPIARHLAVSDTQIIDLLTAAKQAYPEDESFPGSDHDPPAESSPASDQESSGPLHLDEEKL